MKGKNIKVIWPNNKETFVSEGDNWFSSAEKAGLEIPTGCLTGSCGACEIDVNGATVRACISDIKNNKKSLLKVTLTTDPFWEEWTSYFLHLKNLIWFQFQTFSWRSFPKI